MDNSQPPTTIVGYDVTRAALLSAAASLIPQLRPLSDLSLVPLHGGMSNLLFVIEAPSGYRVVARLLNPSLDAVIDRAKELAIFVSLADIGIAPRVLGTALMPAPAGTSGRLPAPPVTLRLEQHLYGRTLTVHDFRQDSSSGGVCDGIEKCESASLPSSVTCSSPTGPTALAPRIAAMHGVYPGFPHDATSTFVWRSDRYLARIASLCARTPADCTAAAAEVAAEVAVVEASRAGVFHSTDEVEGARARRLYMLLRRLDWAKEVRFVSAALEARGGPLVLCHNDAQPGNWILAAEADGGDPSASSAAVTSAVAPYDALLLGSAEVGSGASSDSTSLHAPSSKSGSFGMMDNCAAKASAADAGANFEPHASDARAPTAEGAGAPQASHILGSPALPPSADPARACSGGRASPSPSASSPSLYVSRVRRNGSAPQLSALTSFGESAEATRAADTASAPVSSFSSSRESAPPRSPAFAPVPPPAPLLGVDSTAPPKSAISERGHLYVLDFEYAGWNYRGVRS